MLGYAYVYKYSNMPGIPAGRQISRAEQYSPSTQEAVARQVVLAWQVRGPPLNNSLQVVEPVSMEQSDMMAQNTK